MGRKSGQLLARRTAQVNPSSYRGLWRFAQISRSGYTDFMAQGAINGGRGLDLEAQITARCLFVDEQPHVLICH